MTAPRTPSRTPSFPDSITSASSQNSNNAALAGATLAFGARPTPRKTNNSYTGANGALAAATSAGSKQTSPVNSVKSPSAHPLVPSSTGGSVQDGRSSRARDVPSLDMRNVPNLGLPPPDRKGQSKSPSHQAAFLAAARSPSPLPPIPSAPAINTNDAIARAKTLHRPAAPPKPRRLSSVNYGKKAEEDKPTDATPIPPTTSLVDLFERKAKTPPSSGKRPEPIVVKPSTDLPLRSPKPVRTSGIGLFQMEMENGVVSPPDDSKPVANDFAEGTTEVLSPSGTRASSSDSYASASEDMGVSSSPPMARKRDTATSPKPMNLAPIKTASPTRPRGRTGPSPSPLRYSNTGPIKIEPQPGKRSVTSPPETFSPSSASASLKSIQGQYNQLYPRHLKPNMTGDQLSDAMVASSLASSRNPSPARKNQPPPPPTRRPKHQHTLSFSRTPSPSKKKDGMLSTLRSHDTDTSDDDDDELHPYSKHKRKKHIRKHPNKHHEGDRKRWREAVTERERKRYEGVWAANKGLYTSNSDEVAGIIVKDIWLRSRLPDFTLEEVWDLVVEEVDGSENSSALSKAQFCVGMWLIDQRLKGRKLPTRVSESVWASVRGLQGIKIRK